MSVSPRSVLILGFGAFGRLAARALAPYLPVAVCDPDAAAQGRAAALGLPLVPAGRAGEFDIVLLAVPVPALAGALALIAPHLRAGQIVADVCSVKEGPAALMCRALPEGVEILAHVALNLFTNYVNLAFAVPVDFPAVKLSSG